jgi:hypothetical protein
MDLWNAVRPTMWAAFRAVLRLNLMLSRRKYRYVFILGHVRSGSTLLSHILASHPEFVGAGEMHISYQTPADLQKLVFKTCELLHRPFLRETYIVDQINHEYVSDDVLRSDQICKCIILIREPETALASMMNLRVWQEKQALDLYVNRLEALTRYGMLLRERALLVEYDDLIDHTDDTLTALTSFLDLELPLTSNYSTHRMTGKVPGFGDPSNNIKIGRVVRTPKHEITISNDTLIAAASAFRKCREQLLTTQTANEAPFRKGRASMPAPSE